VTSVAEHDMSFLVCSHLTLVALEVTLAADITASLFTVDGTGILILENQIYGRDFTYSIMCSNKWKWRL
jgi:hypothetical protein